MDTYNKSGNPEDVAHGYELISSGKVGCIALAGGDGSRLGWNGPKGSFPLSLVKQKPLFQMLMERVDAASKHFHTDLKLAVMTSPLNHEITKAAFSNDVDLFQQSLIPLLDMDENPLKDSRPNGNGEVFKCFYESGLYANWKAAGIEYVQVILIDNPLAEPFDPNQIGIHAKTKADITIKAVKKSHPEENVGVIGKKGGKICIIEYSENPPKKWDLANISLFSFHMDFINKVKDVDLPVHKVKKFIDTKPVLKRECFIFDLLPFAKKIEVILYPREETFAPLKSREDVGPVQRALLDRDRKVFARVTGIEPKEGIFELHPEFHYPTEELKKKWKGISLPKASYIIP